MKSENVGAKYLPHVYAHYEVQLTLVFDAADVDVEYPVTLEKVDAIMRAHAPVLVQKVHAALVRCAEDKKRTRGV